MWMHARTLEELVQKVEHVVANPFLVVDLVPRVLQCGTCVRRGCCVCLAYFRVGKAGVDGLVDVDEVGDIVPAIW